MKGFIIRDLYIRDRAAWVGFLGILLFLFLALFLEFLVDFFDFFI